MTSEYASAGTHSPGRHDAPTRQRRRSTGADQKQSRILDVATELFAERGYHATTLTDLADALEIAKATLFHYFTSKEKILAALYARGMETSLERIGSIDDPDPEVRLRSMLREHALVVMRNVSLFRVCFGEEASLEPENLRRILDQQRQYIELLAVPIRQLQSQGRVSKTVRPRVAAQSLMGMGSWSQKWYERGGAMRDDDIAAFMADLSVGGLLAC